MKMILYNHSPLQTRLYTISNLICRIAFAEFIKYQTLLFHKLFVVYIWV